MFELARLDDGGLLAVISESLREERIAVARRLVAAGLLTQRRVIDAEHETASWCVEDWDLAAAEIGAELGVSRYRASSEMSKGQTLVGRFPTLAEKFLAGDIEYRVFADIDFRTASVKDPDILGCLCFLVSGHLALLDVCGGSIGVRAHQIDWWVVAVNQIGSVLFFLAGLAAFTRPATSRAVDIGLVNWGTFAGAVCFAFGGLIQVFDKPTPTRTAVQHTS